MRPAALAAAAALALPVLAFVPGAAAQGPACLPGLTATAENVGSITLVWPAVDGALAYQVLVRSPGSDWFPVTPQVPASGTAYASYASGAVTAGVAYEFQVAAVHSGEVLATYCGVTATYDPPACPAGLTAELRPDGSVLLEWDAVAGADGYNVYGPKWDGPLLFMGHLGAAATSMVDADPVPDVPLAYTVNATVGALESPSCQGVQLAAVPVFPAPAALALALVGSLAGALLVLRKR